MTTGSIERFETERIICERLRPEHGDELKALLLDERVFATLWPRSEPPTERDVLVSLETKVQHWERHGFGMWLLRDRGTGEMLGRGGLQYTYVAGLDDVEAGWAIVPERWREGLATEFAQACTAVALDRISLLSVVAFTQPDNVASRRVMEKAGFRYEAELVHVGLPHVLYRRNAPRR
jgi:ribosomal-protein-alanine N-acetyltransferase